MTLRRLLLAVLVATGYFALFGGEYGLFELWRLERRKSQEAAQLEDARAELARLRARSDSLESDPGTLERIARERYGLIRRGERLYRFVGGETGAAPPAERPE